MKKTPLILIAIVALLISFSANAQFNSAKNFDFSSLEGKTLYIPTLEVSSSFAKRMKNKGKLDKLEAKENAVDAYNDAWKQAMAESSYDATDYQIGGFDKRELIKNKDKEAAFLDFNVDDYGNISVAMYVTYPKRTVIAGSLINGFDLTDKNDLRLMMNLINEVLNQYTEVEESGSKKSGKNLRLTYFKKYLDYYDDISSKTFLVPTPTHKKPEKAAQKTKELEAALKGGWKLCNYELLDEEEINLRRLESDPDYFYWRSIPMYTNLPVPTYYNFILSGDNDELLTYFLGKGKMKPATLQTVESKMQKKAENWRKKVDG